MHTHTHTMGFQRVHSDGKLTLKLRDHHYNGERVGPEGCICVYVCVCVLIYLIVFFLFSL